MKDFLNERQFSEKIQILKNNKTYILSIIILSILYVLPIVLANTHYVDDLNRTVAGYNWDHDGRFVSSKIMHLLSFQKEVVYSLYPFSNMISAVILALSGFIISYSVGVRNKLMLFIGSFLLLTCPFLLEILSYRFDCIPISLSILCIAVPFLFYNNKKIFFAVSIIGVFLSLGLYQTSALSYCIILCFLLAKDVWNDQFKTAIISLLTAAASFVIGFFSYKVVLKLLDLNLLKDRRADFIFTDDNLKMLLKERFYSMIDLVKLLMFSSYRFVFYILLFFSVLSIVIYFKNNFKTLFNKILIAKVIITLVLIFCILIFMAGVNMFVYEPRWVPRAMIGWAVGIYGLYFAISLNSNYKNIITVVSFTPFIYYSFLMSSQLAIYLKNQDEFSDYIINLLSPKLFEHGKPKVIINGVNKTARRNITINFSTMPLIYQLAPIYENNGWGWGIIRLNKFDNISSVYIGDQERLDILAKMKEFPIVDKNVYYTLRIKDDIAIVDFDRNE